VRDGALASSPAGLAASRRHFSPDSGAETAPGQPARTPALHGDAISSRGTEVLDRTTVAGPFSGCGAGLISKSPAVMVSRFQSGWLDSEGLRL